MDRIQLHISPHLQPYIVRAFAFRQKEGDTSIFRFVPRLFPGFLFISKDSNHIYTSYDYNNFQLKPASVYYAGVGCKQAKIVCSSNMLVIVVLLLPYSASLFFRDDACHFSETKFEMTDMFPDVRLLNEQINETDCLDSKWQFIQTFFANRFSKKSGYTHNYAVNAVQFIHNHKGIVEINEIAQQICTSSRNLLDVFKHHIGISPKKFADALRFNTFVNCFQQQNLSLFETALTHGYYDLSHLYKDFLRFTGVSAKEFFTPIQTPQLSQFGNWDEAEYLALFKA